MKLSKNFSRYEFTCQGKNCCGGTSVVDSKLIEALQELRDLVNAQIDITSGFRCNKHNASLPNSSPASYHTLGLAADIKCEYLSPKDLAKVAEQVYAFKNGGIGIYKSWVHVDIRKGIARW